MGVLEKLMQVQSELKAPKGQYNSFGNYKYRSCEDILEALKPILVAHKCTVTLTDTVEQIGDRYYIKATARITDTEGGDSEQNTAFAREDADKRGMDVSQITGTASSYARKYALNGLFLIDDTKDADTDAYHEQTHPQRENPHRKNPQQTNPQQKKSQDAKLDAAKAKADEVKKLLVQVCGGDKTMAQQMWTAQYKAYAGDIVKMNAALIELTEKLERMNALDA